MGGKKGTSALHSWFLSCGPGQVPPNFILIILLTYNNTVLGPEAPRETQGGSVTELEMNPLVGR